MKTKDLYWNWQRRVILSAAGQRGMTLIEIMIVVIIMSMIASGIAMAVMKHLEDAKVSQAKTNVTALRNAAYLYRAQNPKDCPDVRLLKDKEYLEKNTVSKDPWESDFVVNCTGREIDVFSIGPDMQEGTEDDIR